MQTTSKTTFNSFLILVFLSSYLLLHACKLGPETQDPFSLGVETDVVEEFQDIRWAEHHVVVQEILKSPRYTFVKVEEGLESYWIATGLRTVKPGETYVFNEAVVKKDFRSAALDRQFDSIYLVTQLLPIARKEELKRMRLNPHTNASEKDLPENPDSVQQVQVQKVRLQELFKEPERFENRQIEITAVCTKVNTNIMERNWIHLKGDMGDAKEVVATSEELPKVGESITLRALVRLNKDFGAGYTYPILLEEAILIEK